MWCQSGPGTGGCADNYGRRSAITQGALTRRAASYRFPQPFWATSQGHTGSFTTSMSTQTVGPIDAPILYGNARRLRLKAPQFRRKVVERDRLLARLGDGREHRVVRIWAPAGFGKTILATQLIRSDPRPSAWIALEYADNDAMVLLRDVVAMLGELYAVRPELMLELTSPAPRIEDVVLPGVAEQLAGCDPSILVLDDLDQVTHPDSLVIVSFLIEHAPAGSQLVLVSRTEPEVPLARLRAAGEVLDLRAADLAFDARETGALLGDGGVVLSDEEVDQIRGRAEGWATGMALAMLSPDGPSIALGRPAIALGGSLEVAAYLLEEAVGGQPAERRAFLFGSSLLRRMSASLCDAALGIENSGRMIAALERESLFIVALNGDGEWYGYHDLFRELLESEMQRQSPDLVAGILRRAAAWHDERGDTREVVRVRVHRGDLERAGRILLRSGELLIARGQIETVRGWMGRCTREETGSNPQLALAGAWIALLSRRGRGGLVAVAETAGDLDVPSADGATSLRSSLANVRATLAADGISQMLRDAEFVVEAERRAGTRWIMDGGAASRPPTSSAETQDRRSRHPLRSSRSPGAVPISTSSPSTASATRPWRRRTPGIGGEHANGHATPAQ